MIKLSDMFECLVVRSDGFGHRCLLEKDPKVIDLLPKKESSEIVFCVICRRDAVDGKAVKLSLSGDKEITMPLNTVPILSCGSGGVRLIRDTAGARIKSVEIIDSFYP